MDWLATITANGISFLSSLFVNYPFPTLTEDTESVPRKSAHCGMSSPLGDEYD